MNVFALQEQLETVRVQRTRVRGSERVASAADATPTSSDNTASLDTPPNTFEPAPERSLSRMDSFAQLSTTNISEQEIITALHPNSAEYALRTKYLLFMHQILGKGAFGEVFVGRLKDPTSAASCSQNTSSSTSNTGDLFAIKRIDKRRINSKSLSQLMGEVETLSLLSHSNVIRLQEVFQDDDFLWIVMEYARGGDLGKVLKRVGRLSETVARKISMSFLLAIEYIHDKGIVHRDLKPGNCLLTKVPGFMRNDISNSRSSNSTSDAALDRGSGSPKQKKIPSEDLAEEDYDSLKIVDFGFAAMVGRAECLTNFCGTMHYMAPEVIRRDGLNYGKPVDMWSFGVILYLMLSGEFPFANSERICQGKLTFANSEANDNIWTRISPQAKDFVSRLLTVDHTKRLTAQEALRHPWVKFAYSDSDEVSDYPTTKGIWRTHSRWVKTRRFELKFRGAAHAVIFAHRLIFLARLQSMRREGIADISLLRHFPYIVHGTFEPANHVAVSGKRFFGNVAALRRLAEMVGASSTVEIFDVSNNNIDDLGLVQLIVKIAYTHPSLTCLNLENNPIPQLTGRALIRLARSPTHKLNVINVNNTNLGYDTIQQVDGCLKETIRKRLDMSAALSVSSSSMFGSGTFGGGGSGTVSMPGSPDLKSTRILRASTPHDELRSATASPSGSRGHNLFSPVGTRCASPFARLTPTVLLEIGEGDLPSTVLTISRQKQAGSASGNRATPPLKKGSQLPPLTDTEIKARGAGVNAVRQQHRK